MDKKKKKELIEWGVLILVVGIVYLGGWHTQLIGKFQQAVLYTGIIKPNQVEEAKPASYNFSLRDSQGNEISFADLEGQVVFMNFWATWCPPCIAEMPDIHNLYKSQPDSTRFFMISLDRDKQKAIDYVKEKDFTFPIYFLNSSLPKSYDISSIPTTYVLSKDGNIVIENHGMAKYNSDSFKSLLADLFEAQ